jgi:Domain of unknown function (DUF4347)/Domain of unknown function (DUF4082)
MLWTDRSVDALSLEGSAPDPARLSGSIEHRLSTVRTIAFVDAQIADAATVMANVQADLKVLLDPTQDGIEQIATTLTHYQALTGIEIISHGTAAGVQLGKTSLDLNSLSQSAAKIQSWGSALAPAADILFYGCNVAAGAIGQAFVSDLSRLTGADVAASTNVTGDAAQGGDWDLEYHTGSIETANPFSTAFIDRYHGLLGSVFTTQTPDNPNQSDGVGSAGDYELGMEFTSAKAGKIDAIRYYKSPNETGTHIGRIWSSTGTLLGSVNFTSETASGWQQQALTTPINIAANTTYVVSVNANSYFAVSGNGIATTITNGDLSAVADGSNGVYDLTPGVFPIAASTNNNYFRDIVFSPNTITPPNNQSGTITVSGTATQNQTLTATVADGNGLTGVTINYKWQQSNDNGTTWTDIAGATGKTFKLTQAQVKNRVRATASYTDALGKIEQPIGIATTAVVNVNDVGKVILKGSATVGRTLTETVLDADGLTGVNIQYVWQQSNTGSNWTNISGATTKSFALTSAQLGKQVRLRTTYTDALGSRENIVSAGTAITAQNAIVLENQKTGTTNWQINGTEATNNEIAGYGDATSINKGQALNLKISLAQAGQYSIDVYRLGYYGGTGGRLMSSATGLNGVTQAAPTIDPTTRLVECKWNTSYTLQTAANWTSGLYLAKLTDARTGKQSYVEFVLRDDGRPAELGFQDAADTVAAYNNYGGYSAYSFNSLNGQRAYQVSFDRPIAVNTSSMLTWEYNAARWMESQGYDVSYYSNLDVQVNPLQLYSQNAFVSVGHDEYWSMEMRNNVEQARDNGTNLAFFAANSAYWRVRFQSSSTGAANRIMNIYKDDWNLDPVAQQDNSQATTRFRAPQVNRPENALLGVMYTGYNDTSSYNFTVSNATDPYYANTGLVNGDTIPGLVGYEWDAVVDNGRSPAGLVVLSQSPVTSVAAAPDLPPGTNLSVANSVRYTAASGAKVFATGSIQWVWGLDSDRAPTPLRSTAIQKIATNVLADLGAQPRTPQIFPADPVPVAAVAPVAVGSSILVATAVAKPIAIDPTLKQRSKITYIPED